MGKKLSCRVSPSFMSIIQVFHLEKIEYCKSGCEVHVFSSECMRKIHRHVFMYAYVYMYIDMHEYILYVCMYINMHIADINL